MPYAEYHRKQKERERTIRRRKYSREYSREYRRKHPEKYRKLSPEELIERRKQFGKRRKGEGNPMFGRLGENHPSFGKKRPDQAERMRQRTGEKHPFFGKHHSQKSKDKMRVAQLGKKCSYITELNKQRIGEKNPFYNKKHSQATKNKMSKAMTGKYTGEKNHNFGKHLLQETRDKLSKAMIGKYIGENNPAWKGGISFKPYSSEFNKQLKITVRHRDGYKCQKCGCPEIENTRRLDIHHIDYDKRNCKPFNLISLCKRCNGKVNFNRAYWIRYFTKKIKKIMTSSVLQLHFNYTIQKKEKSLKFN